MPIEAGKVLADRYRLIKPIGRGAQASVWIAEHLALSTHVAVKLIDPELASQKDAQERFKREATAAAKLRSAHVVQILDHGIEGDQPFIVMELLEGEDLFQRIERHGRLSVRETSKIITQVARALARAHAAGIIHRDLKPENVFLVPNEDDEVAKVLDFGVAKVTDKAREAVKQTGVGTLIGTPHYMSPEQVRGTGELDHRTDLWSVGVIAYQCVTGELPFDSEGVGDLLIKITLGQAPVPSAAEPSVPKSFDTWFAKACARDPENRFSSARELAQALARATGASMVPGAGVPRPDVAGKPPPPPRPSGRKPLPPPKKRAETLLDTDFHDADEADALDEGWDDDDLDVDLASRPPPGPDVSSAAVDTSDEPESRLSAAGAPPPLRRSGLKSGEDRPSDPNAAGGPPSGPGAPPSATTSAAGDAEATAPASPAPPPPSAAGATPAPTAPARQQRPIAHAAPRQRVEQGTVTGLATSPSTMPPPPELDGSRRKRVIGWAVAFLVLLAGGLVFAVVNSQMPPSDPVPAATMPPKPMPPPPPAPLPEPTATEDTTDAGAAKNPGASTRPTSMPKSPSTTPPGTPWKPPPGAPAPGVGPKPKDDDLVIEIPLPEQEVPGGAQDLPPAP